jgi:hypothetical protein
MAFQGFECEDGVPAEINLCVATGTHSAGKSTVIEAFNDDAFTEEYGIGLTDPYDLAPKYIGGLLEGTDVPIITGEEAMTAYARINGHPNLATTGYTFERQIAIESMAQWIITEAMAIAMHAATDLQPDKPVRRGIVFVDRSALDGLPYSSLRTDNDQENIDVRQVEMATIGWDAYPTAKSRVWPLRKWNRDFMREYCDIAFIADHTEVPIEDNGFRQTDEDFRQKVAELIDDYYASVLGAKVIRLRGNPLKRQAAVTKSFKSLLAT